MISTYDTAKRKEVLKELSYYKTGKQITKKIILEPEQYIEIYELGLFAKNSFENIAIKFAISTWRAKRIVSSFKHSLVFKTKKILADHIKNEQLAVLKDKARQYYDNNEHIPLTKTISVKELFDLFPSKNLQARSVEQFTFNEDTIFAVVLNFAPDYLWLFIEDKNGEGLKIGGINTGLVWCTATDLMVQWGKEFFLCDNCGPWIKKRICFQCHDHNCSAPILDNNHVRHTVEQFDEMCTDFCTVLREKTKQLEAQYIVNDGAHGTMIDGRYTGDGHWKNTLFKSFGDIIGDLCCNEECMLLDFLQKPYYYEYREKKKAN